MASTSASDLEPREKLERFCFIGDLKPCLFKRRVGCIVKLFYKQIDDIVGLISGKNFVNVIKKCASYPGVRKDEVIHVNMFLISPLKHCHLSDFCCNLHFHVQH